MSDMQKTIFGTVVPTAPHADDLVECSDDTVRRHSAVHYDCKGGAHSNEEDRHEANVVIVTELLDGVVEWSNEYHTENEDYPNSAAHIVSELSHEHPAIVERWIRAGCSDSGYDNDPTPHDDYMAELVEHVCNDLDDFDVEYDRSEYSCYYGDGCCLFSLDIGECEEQIDIVNFPELKALHEKRELDDVLDKYNGEGHVSRNRLRVKDEKTGNYAYTGRETYMPHPTDYPTFEVYTMPGGQWHYVVSAERMEELVKEYLEERNDCEG